MYDYEPTSVPPRRSSRKRTVLIVAAAVAVGVGGTLAVVELTGRGGSSPATSTQPAVAAPAPSPTAVVMSGHISMRRYDKGDNDPEFRIANWGVTGAGGCEGRGGYSDMTEGANVTVYDAAGRVIGAGALEAGERLGSTCRWAFSVPGVPVSPFYQVEVSHRGKATVQQGDVSDVELSLGD